LVKIFEIKGEKTMADKIKWDGSMSYEAKGLGNKNYTMYRIPVPYFSVNGGAFRKVDLAATEDMIVVHEIEQARRLNNLTLDLLVYQNFDWVYDLLEIAARDLPLSIAFFVNGQIGKTLTHAFRLVCKDAKITQPQESSRIDGTGNRFLTIRLAISDTKLIHGSHQGNEFIEEDW
jgi:hypothetical protein